MKDEDIILLFERRGFLIEQKNDSFFLSDNSHVEDGMFLGKLLEEFRVGYIDGNRIVITNSENTGSLKSIFEQTKSNGAEQSWTDDYRWYKFKYYEHGMKVSVSCLEANVAAYCKAVSACGLDTISSCDGNHGQDRAKLFVLYTTKAYEFWHSLLWEQVLQAKFDLTWENNYTVIRLDRKNREKVYDELFRAAKFLYKNRILFRELKTDTTSILTKKYVRHHSDEEIKAMLSERMTSVLHTDRFKELLAVSEISENT